MSMSTGVIGFENPTSTYRTQELNLSELVANPPATFIYTKSDTDTCPLINKTDWVLIDAAVPPEACDLVLAEQYGETSLIKLSKIQSMNESILILGTASAIIRWHKDSVIPAQLDDFYSELHSALIPCPEAAFISRAQGSKMTAFGITDNALLIVRRDVKYEQSDLVIIYSHNRFKCRYLNLSNATLDDGLGNKEKVIRPLHIEGAVTASINLFRPLVP